MKTLILSATAALLVAGLTFPALADASSTSGSESFSAAEFFADRSAKQPANPASGTRVRNQAGSPVPYYYRASTSRSVPLAAGLDSLTHDTAEYDE